MGQSKGTNNKVHATTGTCWCGYINGRIAAHMNKPTIKPAGVFSR